MKYTVLTVLSVLLTLRISECHVALTFPPARKFDFDFLDNGRTLPPCGMPKGSIRTSLLAGSSFNVTWHLAYPHKGGFQLEVLDEQEKHVMYLTPKRDFASMDPTAQYYEVSLPADFRCRDCTLRLVRQAKEWGSTYQFFTCADVDILPRQEYREDCSGQGRVLPGRQLMCRCNRLYSGPRCQNKEECIEDRDCGSHGKCVDIEALTAPRKQCFCEAGWFGPGCSNKSPVKSAQIDLDSYRKKVLDEGLTLYWRTLKNGDEIEFALVSKGTSYVALGWRPAGLTESCRTYPEIVGPTGEYEKPSEKPTQTTTVATEIIEPSTNATVSVEHGADGAGVGDEIEPVPEDYSDHSHAEGHLDHEEDMEDTVLTGSEILSENSDSVPSGVFESSSTGVPTTQVLPTQPPSATSSQAESSSEPKVSTSDKVLPTQSPSATSSQAESSSEPNAVSTSVVGIPDGVEYEVEYYEDGNATVPENDYDAGLENREIPGGLLSLTPTASVPSQPTARPSMTVPSSTGKALPKMETDGWKPITGAPVADPESVRIPVSEAVDVDLRTSTVQPSTKRLTGLDKLRQKLSSNQAEATEGSVGKGLFRPVVVKDFDQFEAPEQGEWFSEQNPREKRSVIRTKRGFAVPIDSEEDTVPEADPEPVAGAEKTSYDDLVNNPVTHDQSILDTIEEHDHSGHDHSHDDHEHSHGEEHHHDDHDSSDNADPQAEPEPAPQGGEDPVPEPESEPTAEPTSVKKQKARDSDCDGEVRNDGESSDVDWSPRGNLHGMDCTDIVIGMARGSLSRINDYYTRDRSTPRVDTFFGGRNDLTAAFAQEVDGVTTLIFRRKTNASDPTDHPITPGPMHVLWARGQESGAYKHTPKSGLETENPSVPDFYKPDELKYHGPHNRGVVEIDFFAKDAETKQEDKAVDGNSSAPVHDHSAHGHDKDGESGHKHKTDAFCGGEWKSPTRCDPDGSDCIYYARWEFVEKTDEVKFKIVTNYTNKWVGIGFGESSRMSETDAVIGWIDNNGRSSVSDMWILGYSAPKADQQQDIRNGKIQILEGKTTLTFTRKRVTNDKTQDIQFGEGNCVYFKYPVHGGAFSGSAKRINKHDKTPVVSDNRVCIRACPELASAESPGITFVKGPENPQMIYDWSVKVRETAKGFQIPEPGTEEFISFARHVADNLTPALEKIPGFQDVVVKSVSKDGDDVIAHVSLFLEETKSEDGKKPFDDSAFRQVITDTVSNGQIGRLRVDPQYIKLDALGVTSSVAKDEPGGYKKVGASTLYIVIGCLAALFFIFLVQAIVTICTTRKSRSLPPREQMITQSAWKDYSTSQQTNYAYESFGEDIKIASHSSRGSRDSLYENGRMQERMPITRNGKPKEVPAVANSLPRPRYEIQQAINPYPTAKRNGPTQEPHPSQFYPSHRPNGSAAKPGDNQHDFYFMPSQRRYSGEVVRVYVDYNTRPK